MFDFEPYVSLLVSVVTAVVYSVLAWKISGEAFDEPKFLRTVALSFLMALGFCISGTPLDSVYVSPFASTITATLVSKYINNQTKPVITQPNTSLNNSNPAAANPKQNP